MRCGGVGNLRRVEEQRIQACAGGAAVEVADQSVEAEKVKGKLHPISWTVISQGQ